MSKVSTADAILLVVSFTGFAILGLTLYRIVQKTSPKFSRRGRGGEAGQGEEGEENNENRAARRRRQLAQRRNRRRGRAVPEEERGEEKEEEKVDMGDGVPPEDDNEEGECDEAAAAKPMTRKERAKAAKRAEKEERRRYEEQRRDELRQKKEAAEAEYLERMGRQKEEREREKEEEEKLEKQKLSKEKKEYDYWKHKFVVKEVGGGCRIDSEALVGYIVENKLVSLEDTAEHFGVTTKELKEKLKRLQGEGKIFGVMNDQGKFVHVSQEEMQNLVELVRRKGMITFQTLADESNQFMSCKSC